MLSAGCSRSNLMMGSTLFRVRKLEKTEVTAATSKAAPKIQGSRPKMAAKTVSVVEATRYTWPSASFTA